MPAVQRATLSAAGFAGGTPSDVLSSGRCIRAVRPLSTSCTPSSHHCQFIPPAEPTHAVYVFQIKCQRQQYSPIPIPARHGLLAALPYPPPQPPTKQGISNLPGQLPLAAVLISPARLLAPTTLPYLPNLLFVPILEEICPSPPQHSHATARPAHAPILSVPPPTEPDLAELFSSFWNR